MTWMKRILILVCLCFAVVQLHVKAGTAYLTGTVLNQVDLPVVGANIRLVQNQDIGAFTNDKGVFSVKVPEGRFSIIISSIGYDNYIKHERFNAGDTINLNVVLKSVYNQLEDVEVEREKYRDEVSTATIEVKQGMVNTSGGIEELLLTQAMGVSKTNELSSSYSVRGGNFDENLVYVNGFEVYRPFLIRSGQQEGLSFANPNLVRNIKFSSGGFQAEYGDKMSSVLDVTYKRPTTFGGSVSGSLLGAEAHLEGATKDTSFTFLVGFRNKNSRYLLNSLNTDGEYNPSFIDFQTYLTYQITPKLMVEGIANYARNKFDFTPRSRETTFGVFNQVLQLNMVFEGQESDRYQSLMGGLALNFAPREKLNFRVQGSVYTTQEQENFDILGSYLIGEVETDFSQQDFGEIRLALGAGDLHDFARNELNSRIYSGGFSGVSYQPLHTLKWGANYKRELIDDKLNEWERFDSAGYTVPQNFDELTLTNVLKSTNTLKSNRFSAYFQDGWRFNPERRATLTYGVRAQYWDLNQELLITPRVQFSIMPQTKRDKDIVIQAAAGLYYQPPFYREMRNLQGEMNTNLRAQKSAHFVFGTDYAFEAFGRPFKFVTEVYYKHMWDIVPYEIDNVLVRYFGENSARGYSAGIDMRLYGQLVRGLESWLSVSVMQTKEDILNDVAFNYFDAEGARTFRGSATVADSTAFSPGYIPRPTDQRVNFALFFQDNIPKKENLKVHLNLLFATGLPFGPPDVDRHADTLRIPPYRRVDIGFSAVLFDRDKRIKENKAVKPFMTNMKSIWATLEVYNLLGISNTVSYLWIKDIRNITYAVPNFLTNRRVNLKLVVNF